MEQNKIRSYFLYAIGEIALVMIGILLALQVNNWNEDRKSKQELSKYTLGMINDLEQDTMLLHNYMTLLQNLLETNEAVERRMNDRNANLDTLKYLASKDFNPIAGKITNYNSSTYEAMLATGDIDLFNDEIRTEILEHRQRQLNSLNNTNLDIYFNKVNSFSEYYYFESNEETTGSFVNEQKDNIDDERKFTMLFSSMVGYKNYMLNVYLSIYRSMLESSRSLLNTLNKLEQ